MEKIKTTYTINFDAQLSDLTSKVESARKSLQKLMDSGNAPQLEKTFSKIDAQLDKLRTKASTPIRSNAAFGQMENNVATINTLLENLNKSIDELAVSSTSKKITLLPANEQKKINDAIHATQTFIKQIQAAHTETVDLREAQQAYTKALKKTQQQQDQLNTAKELAKQAQAELKLAQQRFDVLDKQKKKAAEAAEQVKKLDNYFTKEEAAGNKVDRRRSVTFDDGTSANYAAAKRNASNLPDETAYAEAAAALKRAKTSSDSFNASLLTQENALKRVEASEAAAKKRLEELNAQFANRKAAEVAVAYENLAQTARQLGIDISSIDTTPTEENLARLTALVEQFTNQTVQPLEGELQTAADALNGYGTSTERVTEQIHESSEAFKEQNERAGQVDGIMARAKAFVGLQGAANIARRALSDAFQTVKELDAQMTEMAVVTDDNIGGYWDQLPEYTKRANALGVSIKSTYEAATLYYQQGLKTNEVIAVSNETLKMARISGLSAAEATDRMTAALRGFNMEVNEANAQRIDDVYSKLAAITASDVDEISSAMTKTASIASSAGMEFETTAAFLSQIIETTRESAETAGTALKTVIARFQELKKDPSEIGLVDGEEIDANQIETALKSVGVALRDTNGEFRQLDQVFLELASKWSTLDTNTQRYIATIAAGSRQQSRFIAMMQDYSRTQELVTAANNAAGSAQEQYGKTLDSLDTKLARLKNSWDTFILGLTNNEFIKMAIDLLNGLISAINAVTKGWDSWSGSALKIGVVTAALIAGDKAIKAFKVSLASTNSVLTAFGAGVKAPFQSFKNLMMAIKNAKFSTMTSNLKAYQTSLNYVTKCQNAVNAATEKYGADSEITLAMKKRLTKAEAEHAFTVSQFGVTQKAVNDITALGVSEDMAKIAILKGVTAEELKTAIATNMRNGMSREAAVASALESLGVKNLNKELTLENIINNNWLLSAAKKLGTRIISIFTTKKETGAEAKNTVSKVANTVATNAQSAANVTLAATMLPVLIGILAMVAAIALLVAAVIGIIAFVKWCKANSPEGRINALNEAISRTAEEATAASDAYSTLLNDIEDYQNAQEALSKLTYGTREWKDALIEANSKVLTLLDTYPELAKYVSRGDMGQLVISQEGFDAVAASKQRAIGNAQAANAMARMDLNKEKIAQSKQGILNSVDFRWDGFAMDANFDAVAEAYAENIDLMSNSTEGYNEALSALSDKVGVSEWQLKKLEPQIKEYNALLEEQGSQLKSNAQIALTMQASDELKAYEYSSAIIDTFTEALTGDYADKKIQETVDSFDPAGSTAYQDQESFKRIAEKYGVSDQLTGDDTHSAQVVYAAMKGKTFSEVKELGLSDEAMLKEIARMDYTSTMSENMDKLAGRLKKTTPEVQKKIAGLMSDSGKLLTVSTIKELKSGGSMDEALQEMAKELGYGTVEALAEDVGMDSAELSEFIINNAEKSDKAFDRAKSNLNRFGLENLSIGADIIGLDATKALAQKLEDVVTASGVSAAKNLNNNLFNPLFELAGTDADKVANLLTKLDWTDAAAIDKLPEQIQKLGISIPTTQLDNFITGLKEAAHAIDNVKLEDLNKQMETTSKIIADIQSGEQGRSFEEDQYTVLKQIEGLENQFAKDLNGNYIYIGESMQALQKALEDNTNSQLQKGQAQLVDKMKAADIVSGLSKYNTSSLEKWDNDTLLSFISEFTYSARARGVNIDNLGISGFTGNNLDKLSDDKMEEIVSKLVEITNARDSNAAIFTNGATAANLKSYLSQDAVSNSVGATQLRQRLQNKNLTDTDRTVLEASLNGYTAALTVQANEAGVSQTAITNYTTALAKLKDISNLSADEQKRLTKEVEGFERQVANTAALKKSNTAMQTHLKDINDAYKSYQKLNDETEKINATQEMVDVFGITATKENYQELVELAGAASVGNEEAFQSLLRQSAAASNVTDNLDNLFQFGTTGYNDLSKAGQEWADKMAAAGLGAIVENENGIKEFVSYAKDQLESLADIAGTSAEKWENPYTWLYNENARINALIRQRTLLEREWEESIANSGKNLSDVLDNVLEKELENEQRLITQYKKEILGYTNDLTKIIKDGEEYFDLYNYDIASGVLTVDWAKADSRFAYNSDAGKKFEDFIGTLEENRDNLQDLQDAILDAEDTIKERIANSRSAYIDIINQIKDALVEQRQQEIDKLSTINDTIKDVQDSLVDKLQDQIDDQRNARELDKTKSDLDDKRAQLNYLKASGGSQLEILQLQKEIDNASQDYTDTLVDNALDAIQTANDKAAEQREEQINLATAQLETYKNSQQLLEDAKNKYGQAIADFASGKTIQETALFKLLNTNLAGLTDEELADLGKKLQTTLANATEWSSADTQKKFQNIADTYAKAAESLNNALQELGIIGNGEEGKTGLKIDNLKDYTSQLNTIIDLVAKSEFSGIVSKAMSEMDAETGAINFKTASESEDMDIKKNYLINLAKQLNQGGITPNQLRLDGFTDDNVNSNFSNLSSQQINTVFNNVKDYIKGTDYYNKLYNPAPAPSTTPNKEVSDPTNNNGTKNDGTDDTTDPWEKVHRWTTYQDAANAGYSGILGAGRGEKGRAIAQYGSYQNYLDEMYKKYIGGLPYYWRNRKTGEIKYTSPYSTGSGRGGFAHGALTNRVNLKYANGGLADFTGPAWLDGTKSKPEMVLNAADTANFIQLKDILSDILRGGIGSLAEAKGGDNYYNIDIQVDELSSDYDVDQVADHIKEIITNDAMYRNVNAIDYTR